MKIVAEFREFISKGSAIDLAVGIIIGGAFGQIINSFVNDLIMPILGILLGRINFVDLVFQVGNSQIRYGNFIQQSVNFILIAIVIFGLVKIVNRLNRKKQSTEVKEEKVDENIELLREIRDQLKKANSK